MSSFSWFRKVAMAEGISFLVLLFIAMPLKYLADIPLAVSVVGGLHGFLFVAYMGLAGWVMVAYRLKIWWLVVAFIASLIPFGTFVMEKKWKAQEEEKAIS